MTALADIQKALNAIRRITQQEAEAVRLEALALMAGVIADEAKDIEKRREPKPKAIQRKPIAAVPQPKPAQKSAPTPQTTTPSTEPEVRDYSPKQPLKPVKPE
jgi:ubiquinone/menaquinone biosynthesis C-methylase UbiE